jgi:hypothetical protein
MGDDIQTLAEMLAQAAKRGCGAHLTPLSVEIALSALRVDIERTRRMFQIELMNGDGLPMQVLAVVSDPHIARAVFDETVRRRPGCRIRLRRGQQVDAQTK